MNLPTAPASPTDPQGFDVGTLLLDEQRATTWLVVLAPSLLRLEASNGAGYGLRRVVNGVADGPVVAVPQDFVQSLRRHGSASHLIGWLGGHDGHDAHDGRDGSDGSEGRHPGGFAPGSTLRHRKSGGSYVVVLRPDQLTLADTTPAYGYRALRADGLASGVLWVREREEMEDGRFELLSEPAAQQRGPDIQALLRPPAARYRARLEHAGTRTPAAEWDCTDYLLGHFTSAEVSELLLDERSALSDLLLADPAAPRWPQGSPAPRVIVSRAAALD